VVKRLNLGRYMLPYQHLNTEAITAFGMPSALTLAFCIAWSICFPLPLECRYRHICSIRSLSLYDLPVIGEFSFPAFGAEMTAFGSHTLICNLQCSKSSFTIAGFLV
jgi:hypothetical protein